MMNYTDLEQKISKDLINYQVKEESLMEVFNNICKKYKINNYKIKNKILTKVIHNITIMGYDIDNIKPLKFKSYID